LAIDATPGLAPDLFMYIRDGIDLNCDATDGTPGVPLVHVLSSRLFIDGVVLVDKCLETGDAELVPAGREPVGPLAGPLHCLYVYLIVWRKISNLSVQLGRGGGTCGLGEAPRRHGRPCLGIPSNVAMAQDTHARFPVDPLQKVGNELAGYLLSAKRAVDRAPV